MQRTACSASQSRGSSPYCLLQSREIQNSGLGRSNPFFPQLSGFQLFPTCCCFWHVSSSRGSGGLCYSLSDYYRNCGHLHEKGRKCKLLILHNFFQFSFSFMLSNYILFWPLTSCVQSGPSISALWTVHEIILTLPQSKPAYYAFLTGSFFHCHLLQGCHSTLLLPC